MSHSYKVYGFWAEFDGRKVTVEGHDYILRVTSYMAIFPVEQRVISVYADPVDKDSQWYWDHHRQAGGAWSTDVLESFEFENAICADNEDIVDYANEWLEMQPV